MSASALPRTAVSLLACGLLAVTAAPAAAAGVQDVPSVDVIPAPVGGAQPNDGQWFVLELEPEQSGSLDVILRNPADVAQTVRLYSGDLSFDAGTPALLDDGDDVTTWITLSAGSATVPARSDERVTLTVRVPTNAEPGDHIGAVVAEAAPVGTDVQVVKRVATRLTVTVPGEATRGAAIADIEIETDNLLWPRRLDVTVQLQNTGRIRLRPEVSVGGRRAQGSEVLLSQSTEPYRAAVDVPWYGGRVRVPAEVRSEAGTEQAEASRFVIPWALIALVLLVLAALAVAVTAVVSRRRRAARERRELEEKVRRLEQLTQDVPAGLG